MLSRNASRRNQRRAGARKMRVEHRREGQQRAEEAERQRGALYRADRADVTSARTATPLRPSHVRASASLRQAETMIAFELSTNAPMRIFPALPWLPSARAPVHGPACAGRSKPDGRGDQTSPAARCPLLAAAPRAAEATVSVFATVERMGRAPEEKPGGIRDGDINETSTYS